MVVIVLAHLNDRALRHPHGNSIFIPALSLQLFHVELIFQENLLELEAIFNLGDLV